MLGKTCYLCVEKINHDKTCYPQGFDKLLQEQVDYMAGVVITDEEISSGSRQFVVPTELTSENILNSASKQ